MKTSELDEEYDSVVAVHGFNPLAPQDPYTKNFDTVAQDRIREAYKEVQRKEGDDKDVLFVLTGGPYKERLDDYLTENDHDSVEEHDLPSEAELMKNQLNWMYEDGDGRLDAEETGWDNEHGDYTGSLKDIDPDIALESESQNTEENIDYLLDITRSSEASELITVTSSDHAGRAGDAAFESIEKELNVPTYSKRSRLGYAAPERDEEGNITELNPDKVDLERGNELRPIVDATDENIWDLFGNSRDEHQNAAEELCEVLERYR